VVWHVGRRWSGALGDSVEDEHLSLKELRRRLAKLLATFNKQLLDEWKVRHFRFRSRQLLRSQGVQPKIVVGVSCV